MSAAETGLPYPVCEIFSDKGFRTYIIRPTAQGTDLFSGVEPVSLDPSNRIDLEFELISKGNKHFLEREKEWNLQGVNPEQNYETPGLSNNSYYISVVYSNHPVVGKLVSEYQKALTDLHSSSEQDRQENQKQAEQFIQTVESYTYPKIAGIQRSEIWRDLRPTTVERSVKLDNMLKTYAKSSGAKGGARRRSSRKYKKSKRVLRRKSRSTRRR